MNVNLLKQIDDLKKRIENTDVSREAEAVSEWGGADVVIKSRLDDQTRKWLSCQPEVISMQHTEPRRRAVITDYSKELSWLFYELKKIFAGHIDYISKYNFYGILAQSAINYLENNECISSKELLLEVLDKVRNEL